MVNIKKETVVSGEYVLEDTSTETGRRDVASSYWKTIIINVGETSGRNYRKVNERLRGYTSNLEESS